MKKNIIIYGLIAGIVVSALMLFSVNNLSHREGIDYDTSLIIGYASMLIAFSLVFVGIRNYRDKYNDGVISFGKAFKIGILIVLIASTIYVAAWLVETGDETISNRIAPGREYDWYGRGCCLGLKRRKSVADNDSGPPCNHLGS